MACVPDKFFRHNCLNYCNESRVTFTRVFATLGLDLELDHCMQSPYQQHQSDCRTSLICFAVRIIKIGALEAELRFHVSLPRGNTRGMSRTLGDVIHAPYRVTEQGLHL